MSIYKRGGVWWAYLKVGGRRIRQSTRTSNRAEAALFEARLRQESSTPKRGIEEALLRFLETHQHLKTYKNYLSTAKLIRSHIRGKTFDEAHDAADAIRKVHRVRGDGSELSNSSRNRRLALLRRLCRLAFEWGWINRPIHIRLLSGELQRHVYLTAADIQILASHTDRARDAILLAAYTGLRKSEILRLKPENIRDGWILLDANTKSGRARGIPIPQKVSAICKHLPLGITKDILRNEFETARVKAGMPHVRFHDLRHSYASLLASQGVSLRIVGELLGHSSPTVTQRYAHLYPKALKDAVRKLK